jgi:tetratricopeptide (TPR) repeat protein
VKQKRDDEALAQFLAWSRYDENALAPLVRAAEIYKRRKDWASATRMLELAVYVFPYEQEHYTMLGEAAAQSGRWPTAVSAYQVLLGLTPNDPAAAHFRLAEALSRSGRKQEARREVLKALEIAPSFEPAQQLLLKLSGEAP